MGVVGFFCCCYRNFLDLDHGGGDTMVKRYSITPKSELYRDKSRRQGAGRRAAGAGVAAGKQKEDNYYGLALQQSERWLSQHSLRVGGRLLVLTRISFCLTPRVLIHLGCQ